MLLHAHEIETCADCRGTGRQPSTCGVVRCAACSGRGFHYVAGDQQPPRVVPNHRNGGGKGKGSVLSLLGLLVLLVGCAPRVVYVPTPCQCPATIVLKPSPFVGTYPPEIPRVLEEAERAAQGAAEKAVRP